MQQVKSLYVHFPFCYHLCNYCDFYKKKLENRDVQIKQYQELLNSQAVTHQKLLKEQGFVLKELETLYIGGGTPSLWGKEGAKSFQKFLDSQEIKLASRYEFTLEVDPGTCSEKDLEAWMEIGVNRFSLGTQAFDDDMLKILDRKHRVSDIKESLNFFKRNKLNFSVDFLIGAPNPDQSYKRDIKNELLEILDYDMQHMSLYILKARKSYPHLSKILADEIVSQEFLTVNQVLTGEGFNHYEVSNFAQTGFESKHNLKYWNTDSVAAIGPNASGFLAKDQNQGLRYQWKSLSAEYQTEQLDATSLKLERVYLRLRTNLGFHPSHYFDGADCEKAQKITERWVSDGLATSLGVNGIVLRPSGLLILDSLINDFFAFGIL